MKNILIFMIIILLIGIIDPNSEYILFAEDNMIKSIVRELTANAKSDEEKIRRIFYFVRDEIKFGWIYPQEIPAEKVLKNRKGVCMQKANLLVAMARCRVTRMSIIRKGN